MSVRTPIDSSAGESRPDSPSRYSDMTSPSTYPPSFHHSIPSTYRRPASQAPGRPNEDYVSRSPHHRTLDQLDTFYQSVSTIILSKQHPVTGLIPASVAVTVHGDYRDAWVRDNVYSILAVYGLALAYRRLDDDLGRAVELEQSVVKLMRGLLASMMKQAPKVEIFKNTQSAMDALHAKYSTTTGDTVVGDKEWGHLQVDATSIFLLMLAQMTVSGFKIIYTQDEVNFVQNLVYYIERAYRTPDYGIWERGNKINHGMPELNSSSIGMAVAALQAINGINLFGQRGGPSSIIHVLPDEMTRNYSTLISALPRESNSKEIDAALLSVISYPAFAVSDARIAHKTRQGIIQKLGGRYGCKRFLRDGHQTEVENTSRLHYEPSELKIFEHIECEWPLFFTYLILDGIFRNDPEQVEHYRSLLRPILVDSNQLKQTLIKERDEKHNTDLDAVIKTIPDNAKLVPEVYILPKDKMDAEKKQPTSQDRYPNENIPLVWAQSLYILGELLYEGLLSPSEIDPLGRYCNPLGQLNSSNDVVVQVVLLVEDADLQARLAMYGLETQTPAQVAPITISTPNHLRDAYKYLGENEKLGLTGRPGRPIGTLGTCKLYRVGGHVHAFTPHFMDAEEFYLNLDNDFLVSLFQHELRFVKTNWHQAGRPTMTIMLTHSMMDSLAVPSSSTRLTTTAGMAPGLFATRGPHNNGLTGMAKSNLLDLMMSLRSGFCSGVRVRLGRLQEMLPTSCVQSLDFLQSARLDWVRILGGNDAVANKQSYLQFADRKSSHAKRNIRRDKLGTKSPLLSPLGPREELDDSLSLGGSHLMGGQFGKLREAGHIPASAAMPGAASNSTGKMTRADSDLPRRSSLNEMATSPATPDLLSLTLGDRAQMRQAADLLAQSPNLHDQVDLLHYLCSCGGLDMEIEIFDCKATVKELLEEVYAQAARMRMWDIVRQAAGVLRKVVNSLTINITDLVIRQKQVTVGVASDEVVVDSPMGPTTLSDIIYKGGAADIRGAPLVQEILTYLGSFIRAEPHLFDGILRVRTHYIILAMREEVSRLRSCDKEDAVEYLMQLSPSEMKGLLGVVLSAKDETIKGSKYRSRLTSPIGYADQTLEPLLPAASSQTSATAGPSSSAAVAAGAQGREGSLVPQDPRDICISIQSGGFADGNFSRIDVNGHIISVGDRGLNVVVLDPKDGRFVEVTSFDTHHSEAQANELARLLNSLDVGMIVLMSGKDEFSECLNEHAKQAIETVGSAQIRKICYRDSWCIIGKKGAAVGTVREDLKVCKSGPTTRLQETVRMWAAEDEENGATAQKWGSNQGRWIRRRRIDGALQRVPKHFYARVHRLLENCTGITVAGKLLPRDPTVSERTPEEINFAIAVESLLHGIFDPAERQIAVECIMVISKIQERNPEMKFSHNGGVIDVMKIVAEAYMTFWSDWTERSGRDAIAAYLKTCFEKVRHSPTRTSKENLSSAGANANGGDHRSIPASLPLPSSMHMPFLNFIFAHNAQLGPTVVAACTETGTPIEDRVKKCLATISFAYDRNDRLARRLFYDLSQGGNGGSAAYLAKACLRSLPYELTLSKSQHDDANNANGLRKLTTSTRGVSPSNEALKGLDVYGSQPLQSDAGSDFDVDEEDDREDVQCALQ